MSAVGYDEAIEIARLAGATDLDSLSLEIGDAAAKYHHGEPPTPAPEPGGEAAFEAAWGALSASGRAAIEHEEGRARTKGRPFNDSGWLFCYRIFTILDRYGVPVRIQNDSAGDFDKGTVAYRLLEAVCSSEHISVPAKRILQEAAWQVRVETSRDPIADKDGNILKISLQPRTRR